jgi:hypothetical protein
MKARNLLPLVVILAVLLGLVVAKKVIQRPPRIEETVKLATLLPEGISKADLARLDLFIGTKPEQKVVLTHDVGADKWRVTTHHNAPVKKETIEDCLDDLVKLKGEFRSTAREDKDLEQYGLTDNSAFHVEGYKKEGAEPAFRLLIGKSPSYGTVFTRLAQSHAIYISDVDFRSRAGLYGDETDKAPEADAWLNKEILDVDKDKIAKVDLITPDKHIVFEKRKKETKPEAKAETPAEAGQPSEGKTAPETPPITPKVEYEWVLVEGGPGLPHKQTGLDSFLSGLDALYASDIVDPAKKTEWGLETPAVKCVLSVEGQTEPVVLEGGWPDAGTDGYVRVAGAKDDVVYKLYKTNFERLFAKGSELFELPGLNVDKDKIVRVELTQPEGRTVLAKTDNKWTLQEPKADLEVEAIALDTVVNTLASWKAADYAYSAEGAGLDAPTRVAMFTAGPNETHTLVLGAKSKSADGTYARLDGGAAVLVISQTDIEKVFPAPKNLYERTLLDINEEDIIGLQVDRPSDVFLLSRKGEAWTLTAGETTTEAEDEKAEDLTSAVARLQAGDILFGQSEMTGETAATLRVKMNDGAEHVFSIGPAKDGKHTLKLAGKSQVFLADEADITGILPESSSLKKPEPAPPTAPAASEASPPGQASVPPQPGAAVVHDRRSMGGGGENVQ